MSTGGRKGSMSFSCGKHIWGRERMTEWGFSSPSFAQCGWHWISFASLFITFFPIHSWVSKGAIVISCNYVEGIKKALLHSPLPSLPHNRVINLSKISFMLMIAPAKKRKLRPSGPIQSLLAAKRPLKLKQIPRIWTIHPSFLFLTAKIGRKV